jgi:hypothetical protein
VAAAGTLWFDTNQDDSQSTDDETGDLTYVALCPSRIGGF